MRKYHIHLLIILFLFTITFSACGDSDSGTGQTSTTTPTVTHSSPTPSRTSGETQGAQGTQNTPTVVTQPTQGSTTTGVQPTTGTTSTSLKSVDWSNFTYTFSCFNSNPATVTIQNGQAVQDGVQYSIQSPVFADLNNNGHAEAIIMYHCASGGTSSGRVIVFTGTRQQPIVFADLPYSPDAIQASVISFYVSSGILVLKGYGYTSADSRCCPSLIVTSTYQWVDGAFVRTNSTSVPINTPTATATSSSTATPTSSSTATPTS